MQIPSQPRAPRVLSAHALVCWVDLHAVCDPYAELGVPHDATAADVRSAYRRLAAMVHPDAGCVPSLPMAEARMKQLNMAWAMLRTQESRSVYDASLR